MNYIVPGVPLIPQTQTKACWYACAQMLIQWRRERKQATESGLLDPSEDPPSVAMWRANNGISDSFVLKLADDLGLERIPPQTATLEAISSWLHLYGPLWVNGASHITVIAGIDIEKSLVYSYNPSPVNKGRKEWRSVAWLYGMDSSADVASLDTTTTAGVFLHCPK